MNEGRAASCNRIPRRRRLASAVGLAAIGLFAPGAGCPPNTVGNLQVLANGNIEFISLVGAQQAGFDSAQLQGAPLASFRENQVQVEYSDNLPLSTVESQRSILVMARDQLGQEIQLESVGPISRDSCGEDNSTWLNNTTAPMDFADPLRTIGGVSLPDALDIAYPIDGLNRASGSLTGINSAQFAGDPTTPLVEVLPAIRSRAST